LVSAGNARADRHGLGGYVHDGTQAPGRPGGCEDDVARHSRPCRSIGISGALSFACGDLIAAAAGWSAAFFAAGISAAVAWLAVALVVPRQIRRASAVKNAEGLYDLRPVFRNRSAMAYAIAYSIHTLEMSALRGWGVAFLGYAAVTTGAGVLEAAGLAGATAVWVASLKGHGQFAGRLVEIFFGRNLKAMTIARIAIGVVPASLLLLFLARGDLRIPAHRGQSFRCIADSIPIVADSF
jgi:predicted MFS family arabinose efflux permease